MPRCFLWCVYTTARTARGRNRIPARVHIASVASIAGIVGCRCCFRCLSIEPTEPRFFCYRVPLVLLLLLLPLLLVVVCGKQHQHQQRRPLLPQPRRSSNSVFPARSRASCSGSPSAGSFRFLPRFQILPRSFCIPWAAATGGSFVPVASTGDVPTDAQSPRAARSLPVGTTRFGKGCGGGRRHRWW